MGTFDWLFGKKDIPSEPKKEEGKSKKKTKNIESDEGENIIYYLNGKIKERYTKVNGKKHGEWVKYDEDTGDIFSKFSYKNGVIDGPYTLFENKDLYTGEGKTFCSEGNWKDGKLVYNKIFLDGVLDEEFHYKDEKKHGGFKQYHSNGKIEQEGEFKDDEKNGLWKSYNDKGNLTQEMYFSMGLKNGVTKTYFGNGEPDVEINYKNGMKNGIYKEFSESGSGKLKCDGEFKDDNPCGVWKTYNEDGELIDETNYSEVFPEVSTDTEKVILGTFSGKRSKEHSEKLKSWFPEIVNKDGNIDEEMLKEVLKNEIVNDKKEKNTTSNTQEKHDEMTDEFLNFFIEKNREEIKSWFPSLVDDNGNIINENVFKKVLKKKLQESGNL